MSEYGEDKDKRAAQDALTPLNYVEQDPKKRGRATAVAVKGPAGEDRLGAKVVASGRGLVAEEILNLAFENGIRVRQDKDLAELLAYLDLDTPVPTEALEAVAEILSYVYIANGQPNPFDAVLKDVMTEEALAHAQAGIGAAPKMPQGIVMPDPADRETRQARNEQDQDEQNQDNPGAHGPDQDR